MTRPTSTFSVTAVAGNRPAVSETASLPAATVLGTQGLLLDEAGPVTMVTAWTVLRALHSLRIIQAGQDEADLQDRIAAMLERYGLPARREYRFGPRCRADIWCDGVVVEVKKQRPVLADLSAQVLRYAQQPSCREVIVVLQRSVLLPETLAGKPVHVLSLNANWGVAL
jgi:hypothetical protein